MAFSPHTRGCSGGKPCRRRYRGVFPAYAGMFPNPGAGKSLFDRFPRIRGDVPRFRGVACRFGPFSPHTRGCSDATTTQITAIEVFPAYAGMFRRTNG